MATSVVLPLEGPFSSVKELEGLWHRLFDDSLCPKVVGESASVQGVLLLLETALMGVKRLGKDTKELSTKLEVSQDALRKTEQECVDLKKQLRSCKKCATLQDELKDMKRKAKEAKNRMDSIANILRLGEDIPSPHSRKNSAFSLVSQMILGDSPKRNKNNDNQDFKSPTSKTPSKAESHDVIPETVIPSPLLHSPSGGSNSIEPESPMEIVHPRKGRRILKVANVNRSSSSASDGPSVRKNLSRSFGEEESPQKNISMNLPKPPLPSKNDNKKISGLDDSLAEYVKKGCSALDEIWREETVCPKVVKEPNVYTPNPSNASKEVKEPIPSTTSGLNTNWEIKESSPTPFSPDRLNANHSWSFKELRELPQVVGGKKMKQMKLNLASKGKGQQAREVRSDDDAEGDRDQGFTLFAPGATSTQKFDKPCTSNSKETLQLKRRCPVEGPVRTKAAKQALEGIDCKDCRPYYQYIAKNVSPTSLQSRLNICSKHRNKQRYRNDTPPGMFNPILPDTQALEEMGVLD